MAFFALLWKARTIEKYRQNYEKEKINSIVMGNTHIEKTFAQKWRHYRYDTQKRISKTFKKWYPEGSGVSNFLLYLRSEKALPNFLMKSMVGFVGGMILTYLCFMFFVFQLSISLMHATIMSSSIGVLLTFGLAFSYRIRCLVFLLVPQLFSRVGRYTLTCYALVLILTGPATNTLRNSEVLTESMACSQEQVKVSVRQINESMKKPFNAIKGSLRLMMERFQRIASKVKLVVIQFNRLLLSIVGSIHSSYSWLKSISDTCNARLSTPYDRCIKVLKSGVKDCSNTIDPNFSWLCKMAHVASVACVALKPYKSFCHAAEFMDDAIVATLKKRLKNFADHVTHLFHVEIHVQHSRSFFNSNHSASQVAAGIVTEIRNLADPLLTWLSWSSCVTSLFILLIIFRAKYYQNMFETSSRFDNRYITKELIELDLRRQRQGRQTVLPLNRRERAKYISTTSFRLVSSEKVNMNRSVVFMIITTFKLLIHMVADYSLYWVLMTIRYHGKNQSDMTPGIPETGVIVTGNGFIARLFRSIVETLNIPLSELSSSPIPCLPNPYPPDLRRYSQIGFLIFLLWFFALFEPYGLRLRHIIMGQYRPERAKARAMWLYHHILRTRAGFMKFARRKLHREYKYSSERHFTFQKWLFNHVPFQCIRYIFGIGPSTPHCLLCGIKYVPNDPDTYLARCKTPKCPGIFCTSCFSDIGQLCTICLCPADYGDLSDISLEKGSSDDESSDSEAEPTCENRQLCRNNRPYKWTRIPENDNDVQPSTSKRNNLNKTSNAIDAERAVYRTKQKYIFIYCKYNNKNVPYKSVSKRICSRRKPRERSTQQLVSANYTLSQMCELNTTNSYSKTVKEASVLKNMDHFTQIKIMALVRDLANNNYVTEIANQNSNVGSNYSNAKGTEVNKTHNISDNWSNSKSQLDKFKKIINQRSINRIKSRNSKELIGDFHSFFSRHWNGLIYTIIPCMYQEEVRDDKGVNEIKNHKRRKKHKSHEDSKKKEVKDKIVKESKSSTNYRISAFLADWEWSKLDHNKTLDKADNSVIINTAGSKKSETKKVDTIVGMIHASSLWSWTEFSNQRLYQISDKDCPGKEFSTKPELKRKYDKHLHSLLQSSSNNLEAKTDKVKMNEQVNKNKDLDNFQDDHDNAVNSLRRMNNYHTVIQDDLRQQRIKQIVNDESGTSLHCNDFIQKMIQLRKKNMNTNHDTREYRDGDDTKRDHHGIDDAGKRYTIVKHLNNLKNPLTIMRDFCSSIFGSSCEKVTSSLEIFKKRRGTVEKSVIAGPVTCAIGCQYANFGKRDSSTQFDLTDLVKCHEKCVCDAAIAAMHETCTCATQHFTMKKDIGTMYCRHCKHHQKNAVIQYQRKIVPNQIKEKSEHTTDYLNSTSSSSASTQSNETKTDTTVCSLATIDFYEPSNRPKRHKIKVVTKHNRSTCTERMKSHDISTYTDWWSPIVERKRENALKNDYKEFMERSKKYKKTQKTCGVETEGKFVSFKSRTQVIPPGTTIDVLSPSRYLLESQRYYNELFSSRFYPQVYHCSQESKYRDRDKIRSPTGSRRGRHHKTKRLEECYSPRRQISPRKRHPEYVNKSYSSRCRQSSYNSSRNRTNRNYK